MWIADALWAAAPGIITGIVLAFWNRREKRREEQDKGKEADRIENEMMRIDLEVATAQLAYAVATAYRRGAPNGEMETALSGYERAMEKFRKFERKQMAKGGVEL